MTARLPAFRQNLIARLLKQGLNFTEIAARVRVGRHVVSKYAKKLEVGKAIKSTPAAALTDDDVAWLRQMRTDDDERQAVRRIAEGLALAMLEVTCPRCLTSITVLRSQAAATCRQCGWYFSLSADPSIAPAAQSREGSWTLALLALSLTSSAINRALR